MRLRGGLVERFCWWLPKRIDRVWRRTIRLQRNRVLWRIPWWLQEFSDWVAWRAMCRCMDRMGHVYPQITDETTAAETTRRRVA